MELDDKKHFLSECLPFRSLQDESLERVLKQLHLRYEKAGTQLPVNEFSETLLLLRSGSGEARNAEGEFIDRLSSGDSLGFHLANHPDSEWATFSILEDALIYQFPKSFIEQLCQEDADFASFFAEEKAQRLHHSIDEKGRD